ncbi:MAG: hypothetical protein KME18_18435 [Phormidium tanganyikae FI6-MK23]|jgi:hypothetical protein|nr:hypothetical protein [Phormidium tanganyikae FI6-MK23]
MLSFTIGKLTYEDLASVVDLTEEASSIWQTLLDQAPSLTELELNQLHFTTEKLRNIPTQTINEATIWARAIYPMMVLAETDSIRAASEVPLTAKFPEFEIAGIADGVLGTLTGSRITAPFFVVFEAKRAIEGTDPIPQLYGELICAAYLNHRHFPQEPQTIFGAYTVADTWTFSRGQIRRSGDRVQVRFDVSREFRQVFEAEEILKLLKAILKANSFDQRATSQDDRTNAIE